ncbi:FliH/SctL family protein [Ideonella sp.]|uniref:FliH/SctL family protein n=1 Tax=Ideonella sp. TaxID=1929293 RepID=UPI002B4888A8|nr:FliH/SctL family protein [Ideonella sp.]HJV67947.1 FliH/SctL family protein [Ideonella sp.]
MTTSKPAGPRQVPPPAGGAAKPASAYARFIPREELSEFAAWTPGAFGGGADPAGVSSKPQPKAPPRPEPAPAPAAPPEPTAEQWLARIEEARGQGYQQGYRDGLEALEAAKRAFAQQLSAQMAQMVAAFDEQTQGLDARLADTLVQTAVTLARQVVRSEIAQRPELIVQVAEDAIGAVILSARHLRLRLNPKDLPLVELGAADLLKARGVVMQADATLSPGGCIVESDLGQVDARIEQRWTQAAAVFGRSEPLLAESEDSEVGL